MKNLNADPDEAIDRLLTGLREVEPSPGMQQRILHGASERHSTQRHWTFQMPPAALTAWSVASAIVCAIGLVTFSTIARKHHPTEEAVRVTAHSAPASAPEVGTYVASTSDASPRPPRKPRATQTHQRSATRDAFNDDDALAISEMDAPSHPAPPMPLTVQELFLLRMIHQGDPVELAMLDPMTRVSKFADSKAEFERFFAQPEPSKINQPTLNIEPVTAKDK